MSKLTFAEVYKHAVEHPHPNTLPQGGEPEAIYDYMIEWVDIIRDETNDELEVAEKELDESKYEYKNLEDDYEKLHTLMMEVLDLLECSNEPQMELINKIKVFQNTD